MAERSQKGGKEHQLKEQLCEGKGMEKGDNNRSGWKQQGRGDMGG